MEPKFWQRHEQLLVTFGLILATVLIFAVLIGMSFGVKAFYRSQKLADARNQVSINEIQIRQTKQLVEVQKQKADIKIAEAHGIEEAQRIINNTLTPLYLQHEAIQAQESQSNKIIYVPAGNQGIPIVNAVNP